MSENINSQIATLRSALKELENKIDILEASNIPVEPAMGTVIAVEADSERVVYRRVIKDTSKGWVVVPRYNCSNSSYNLVSWVDIVNWAKGIRRPIKEMDVGEVIVE